MSREALIDEVVKRTRRTRPHVTAYVERVLDGDPYVYTAALRKDPHMVGLILGLATGRLEPLPGQSTDTPNSVS